MNNTNKIKYWDKDEENRLVEEINNLVDIDKIIKNHDRKITGITMRIEKILKDPNFSDKIKNKNEIETKYLKNSKPKYYINYNELYDNILEFKSLEEISEKYNKIQVEKIKSILLNLLKNQNDMDFAKKFRIKCLLNIDDDKDLTNAIMSDTNNINNINNINNTNNTNNINNINKNDESNLVSLIINLLNEIKTIKIDIFDIKNRVKIIMNKVDKIEKNSINDSDKSKINKLSKSLKNISDIEVLTEEIPINKINTQLTEKQHNDKIIQDEQIDMLLNYSSNAKIQIDDVYTDTDLDMDLNIHRDKKKKKDKKKKNKKIISDELYKNMNEDEKKTDNELKKELEKELEKCLK